jgi:hypothetical protein
LRGLGLLSPWREALAKALDVAYLFLFKVPGLRRIKCHQWIKAVPPNLFFLWANERLKREYEAALSHETQVSGPLGQSSSTPGE